MVSREQPRIQSGGPNFKGKGRQERHDSRDSAAGGPPPSSALYTRRTP